MAAALIYATLLITVYAIGVSANYEAPVTTEIIHEITMEVHRDCYFIEDGKDYRLKFLTVEDIDDTIGG